MTLSLKDISALTGRNINTVRFDQWTGRLNAQWCGKKWMVSKIDYERYLSDITDDPNADVIAISLGLLDVIDKVIGAKRMDAISDERIEAFQEVTEKAIEELIK